MKRQQPGQRGFSLINVMVAVLVFVSGMLALASIYTRFVNAQTQNQNLTQLAPWSNAFWGIVQANPAILTTMPGTYTQANVSAAPAILRPWLTQITTRGTSPVALANASVQIATGPDAASGNACTATAGCSVTLTFTWSQNGSADTGGATVTRTQVFNYQFGL